MSIFSEYPHSITQNGDITLELVYEFLSLEKSTQHQSLQPELHPALQLQPLYPPMLPVSPAISMSYGWSQNADVSNKMPIAIASTLNSATSQQDVFFENQLWSPTQSYSQNCEVSAMSSNICILESMRVSENRITADFPPSNGNALVSAFSHCGQQEIYGSAAGQDVPFPFSVKPAANMLVNVGSLVVCDYLPPFLQLCSNNNLFSMQLDLASERVTIIPIFSCNPKAEAEAVALQFLTNKVDGSSLMKAAASNTFSPAFGNHWPSTGEVSHNVNAQHGAEHCIQGLDTVEGAALDKQCLDRGRSHTEMLHPDHRKRPRTTLSEKQKVACWEFLVANIEHPYPKEEDRQGKLRVDDNISRAQFNSWFSNQRRRSFTYTIVNGQRLYCPKAEFYRTCMRLGVLTIDQVPKKHRAELRKHRR